MHINHYSVLDMCLIWQTNMLFLQYFKGHPVTKEMPSTNDQLVWTVDPFCLFPFFKNGSLNHVN